MDDMDAGEVFANIPQKHKYTSVVVTNIIIIYYRVNTVPELYII